MPSSALPGGRSLSARVLVPSSPRGDSDARSGLAELRPTCQSESWFPRPGSLVPVPSSRFPRPDEGTRTHVADSRSCVRLDKYCFINIKRMGYARQLHFFFYTHTLYLTYFIPYILIHISVSLSFFINTYSYLCEPFLLSLRLMRYVRSLIKNKIK